jgi:hypothetical protein
MKPAPRQEKVFFSEEKKQKTFVHGHLRSPGHVRQSPKVFWFFFSKKNKPSFKPPDRKTAATQ